MDDHDDLHILQTKKVLFQHGSRNVIKFLQTESECLQSIKNELRKDFSIKNGEEIVLQKFNKEWDEWIDIKVHGDLQDKDKIKVINIRPSDSDIKTTSNIKNIKVLSSGTATGNEVPTNKQTTLIFSGGNLGLGPPTAGEVSVINQQTIKVDVEKIRNESQIYMLKSDDKLFEYHKAMNEACFAEAIKDPSLLKNKQELQNKARQQLHHSDFQYRKGISRSKHFGRPESSSSTKKNITQELRQKRLTQLQEDVKEVDLQLSFSLQQRDKCSNVNNFSKAVEVSQQIDDLRKKKRRYQEELDLLKSKEAASKRVKKCIGKNKKPSASQTLTQFLQKADAPQTQPSNSKDDDVALLIDTADELHQEINNKTVSPNTDSHVMPKEMDPTADQSPRVTCLPPDQQPSDQSVTSEKILINISTNAPGDVLPEEQNF